MSTPTSCASPAVIFRISSFLLGAGLVYLGFLPLAAALQPLLNLITAFTSLLLAHVARLFIPNDQIFVTIQYTLWLYSWAALMVRSGECPSNSERHALIDSRPAATDTAAKFTNDHPSALPWLITILAFFTFLLADYAFYTTIASSDDNLGLYGDFHNILVEVLKVVCVALKRIWTFLGGMLLFLGRVLEAFGSLFNLTGRLFRNARETEPGEVPLVPRRGGTEGDEQLDTSIAPPSYLVSRNVVCPISFHF